MGIFSGTCKFILLLACAVVQCAAMEKNYTILEELPEDVLIGDLVKDLNLTFSPEKTLSTPLQFGLVYKSGDLALVRVEEATGGIYTTGVRMDREKLCSGVFAETHCVYEVEVVVLPDEIFKLVKIRFLIEDINDNAPLFPATVINVSIPENTAINSRFPVPSAVDLDVGINGIQQYHLLNGLDVFGLDVIETPEGEKWPQLIVQKVLDREDKDTYVMKLKVEDGGSPPRSSTALLQVSVIDTNDNGPVFKESEVEVAIPENVPVGFSVYQLHATDDDVGANARIQYFFSDLMNNVARKLFDLNNTTGLITVKEPLDREQAPIHKLMVLATDGGSLPARGMVIVNVTDVNDNPPIIDVRYIINTVNGTVFLSENAGLNTKIALITLIDKDADRNGKVNCFTENDVPFRLRPVFENQFLMETSSFLDYETTKEYEVKLLASDSGRPPLNYTTSVMIKIKDENDNAPIFSRSSIRISVPENNAPGAQLTKISATDADSGKNAEITYLIAGERPSAFSLDNRTGILSAAEPLDREKKDKYTFTVTARDNGKPHLQSNATVIVTVLDQNDNSPTFTHNELLRRARGRGRGKSVTHKVKKPDVASPSTGDYVKYIIAIISGSMTAVLTIVIAALLRCRRFPRLRVGRKQNSEWVTPNPNNSETITISTNDNGGTNSVILNLVTFAESGTDDLDNEEEATTSLDVAIDIEEDPMERYKWGTHSSTFKPDVPDLAQHYKATSPQPPFHIEPETPVHSKHHGIQELPVDNTFVMGCDSLSKCSSSSSDPYSISDCSCQGTIKTTATIHPRQAAIELGLTDPALKDPNIITIRTYPLHLMPSARPRTPVIQETAVDIWTSAQSKPEPKKPGKAQRHVTFHLPESPQESGSDNVPIEAEAGAIAIARPGYARRDYYEHSTTRSNWSEADGNSDPETAAEITVQPTLEEASDNCTQECLILGHSDSCWMPAALPPCQQPRSAEPVVTRHSSPAPHLITTTAMCHNPPEPQPAAICTTPPRSLNQELGPGARAEARGAQGRVVAQDDSHQVRRCSPRALFCTAAHDDSIKVIPMTTFTPGQSSRGYPNIEDDPM